MEPENLLDISQTLLTLKEYIKCPICLDVMQDIVELDCTHRYCKECFEDLVESSRPITCPLCKKKLSRRSSQYKDLFGNKLAEFLRGTCDNIEKTYNLDIDQFKIMPARAEIFRAITSTSTVKYRNNVKRQKEGYLVADSSSSETTGPCEKAFNALLSHNKGELNVKKGIKPRTYKNSKKATLEPKSADKIFDFHDVANKANVLKWLMDKKNVFDKFTLTQNDQISNEIEPHYSLNLPSVSQQNLNKTHNSKRRARSLDVHVRKVPYQSKLQRHSMTGTLTTENYEIEDVNTDDTEKIAEAENKVLLDLMEDEYLNQIENEMVNNVVEPESNKKKDKKTEKSSIENVNSSDWVRLEKIRRSIKKTTKEPKKLNIVLQSTQNLRDNKECSNKKLMVRLEKISVDKVPSLETNEISSDKENVREASENLGAYDLKTVEDYFLKTINDVKINKPKSDVLMGGSLKNKSPNEKNSDEIDNEDDLYSTPTQKITLNSDHNKKCLMKTEGITSSAFDMSVEKTKLDVIHMELDDVYNRPTQKTTLENEEVQETSIELAEDVNDTIDLSLLESDISDDEIEGDEIIEMLESNLQKCVGKLKMKNGSKSLIHNLSKLVSYTAKLKKIFDRLNKKDMVIDVINQPEKSGMHLEETVCEKIIEEKAVKESEILSNSLDNVNFETQDALNKQTSFQLHLLEKSREKNNVLSERADSQKERNKTCSSQKLYNITSGKGKENSLESVLVLTNVGSVSKMKAKDPEKDLVLTNLENKKRFKRIRTPCSDSESDEEKCKRPCDRFIRDDLSIKFDSNTEKIQSCTMLSEVSGHMDYDAYLENVLKKYDDYGNSGQSKKEQLTPQQQKGTTQEMIEACDLLIEKATKTLKQSDLVDGAKPSTSKNVQRPDSDNNNVFTADIFLDEKNISKIDKDIDEFEKHFKKSGASIEPDIISETETFKPVTKKKRMENFSESLFASNTAENITQGSVALFTPSTNCIKTVRDQNKIKPLEKSFITAAIPKRHSDNIKNVDSFEDDIDAELEMIDLSVEEQKVVHNNKDKIIILQNLKVRSQDRFNDSKTRKYNNVGDDETFFSDKDVIETTPQKKMPSFIESRCGLSQLPDVNNTPNTVDSQLDVTLPPPPGFQDDLPSILEENPVQNSSFSENVTVMNMDITPGNNELSQASTPDQLSCKYIRQCPSINHIGNLLKTNIPQSHHPLSGVSINLSPISREKNLNVLDVAHSSKYSPLVETVSKVTFPKQSILTSTPKQKSMWNYVKVPQASPTQPVTSQSKKKTCIACTRLTKDQMIAISCLSNRKLATYSPTFGSNVTHMIVSTNEKHCIKDHTVKFVFAVASGIWVLRFEWIQDCLANNRLMPEEPYEALDVSGVAGPKISRLTRTTNPLLKGYKFHCAAPFLVTSREEVEDIIKMLGGVVVPSPKHLMEKDDSVRIILSEAKATQDYDLFENWFDTYKIIIVDVEWLCRSVSQYKLLSVRPFVLCCDNSICDLGYPSQLVAEAPFTFSDNI